MPQSKFYVLIEVDNDLTENQPEYYTDLYTSRTKAEEAAKAAHDRIIADLEADQVRINLDVANYKRTYDIETTTNHYHLEVQSVHVQQPTQFK